MELSKLIHESDIIKIIGNRMINISQITTDVTRTGDGVMLVAIKVDLLFSNIDSLRAFSAIICKPDLFEKLAETPPCTIICVNSPRRIWALAESRIRNIEYQNTKFIAVTGTNGKTTTATLIKHILQEDGKSVGFIGTGLISIGNEVISDGYYSMTTPDPPILYEAIKNMIEQGVTHIVMEVSSHAIYYEKIAAIRFAISIFTNLSVEHLDFHNNINEYAETKLKLSEYSDLLLFSIDDPVFRSAYYKLDMPKLSYGIIWEGDSIATDICDMGFKGVKFIYRGNDFSFAAHSGLVGKFNIYNALAALSATIAIGVAPCVAKRALANFKGMSGRVETVYNDDIRVVIDYAHNEYAFESLLSAMNYYSSGKIIVIFGCGGERYIGKRAKMAEIAESYASHIYVTSDNQRNEPQEKIFSDIVSGFSDKCNYRMIENRSEAIRTAILDAEAGYTILVVGKGCERYNIDATGYHYFDERDAVKSAIAERRLKNASRT